MPLILPDLQEDAEDLIDDRDVEIPDAAAAPLNYRRINREEEDNAREEDIIRRIEERYKDYQVGGCALGRRERAEATNPAIAGFLVWVAAGMAGWCSGGCGSGSGSGGGQQQLPPQQQEHVRKGGPCDEQQRCCGPAFPTPGHPSEPEGAPIQGMVTAGYRVLAIPDSEMPLSCGDKPFVDPMARRARTSPRRRTRAWWASRACCQRPTTPSCGW